MITRIAKLNPQVAARLVRAFDVAIPLVQQQMQQDTGEGVFAAPDGTVLAWLHEALASEYLAWMTYYTFGGTVRGLFKGPVSEMFFEHADEEAGHAEQLLLWITVLSRSQGQQMPSIPMPPTMLSIADMLRTLVAQEQTAIATYRRGLELAGTKEGFRQEIEGILQKEQEHSNDLMALVENLGAPT